MFKNWVYKAAGNPKRLWIRYCFGLTLIVSLLVSAHIVHVQTIKQGAQDAALIDVSGRQRMLSQRLAGLARFLLDEDQRINFEAAIASALATFETSHEQLLLASKDFPQTQQIYRVGAPGGLDAQSREFIDLVRRALTMSAGDPDLEETIYRIKSAAYAPLLQSLDDAVKAFGSEAEERLEGLHQIQNGALIFALLLLLFEVLLIFIPGQLAVNQSINSVLRHSKRLEEKNERLRRLSGRLEHAANHDQLTGLANRKKLYEALELELSVAFVGETALCIFHIDLDRFKEINDTLGHPVGDAVLKNVADAMRARTSGNDIVARVGGDEFVIVARLSLKNPEKHAQQMADSLIEQINQKMQINGHNCTVGASIGFVIPDTPQISAKELIGNADIALYEAKRAGKGVAIRFNPKMRAGLELRHSLIQELELAVRKGEFVPFLQPKVRLKTGAVTGFEVLIRWDHPERGILLPSDFLELAEETGLVDAIDHQTVLGALDALQSLRQLGWDIPSISVNASGVSLRNAGYADMLLSGIGARGLAPEDIHVEVVENILISDADDPALRTLKHLSDQGVKIDIDDFGTGYASLSMLSKLDLTSLKIDKGLVANLDNARAVQIVEAIVGLARGMELEIVVEGVETPAQFSELLKLDCDTAQGFGIGYPMVFSDAVEWLENYGAGPLKRPHDSIG